MAEFFLEGFPTVELEETKTTDEEYVELLRGLPDGDADCRAAKALFDSGKYSGLLNASQVLQRQV